MAMWKNDDEMFALMKEKLYTPVVGDILDQMGYKHQFLPASIRPLAAQVPTAPYILPGEEEDKRLKVAGYACTVLENDVFEYPAEKPFGYMTEALDDLKPNEIVFGDIDGVLIIPKDIAPEVIEKALVKASTEKTMRKAIEDGMMVTDAFAKFGVL